MHPLTQSHFYDDDGNDDEDIDDDGNDDDHDHDNVNDAKYNYQKFAPI